MEADRKALRSDGGEAGIRTLGEVAPTTIFETVPFNRSGTSPRALYYKTLTCLNV
jgi:hypothetical protein